MLAPSGRAAQPKNAYVGLTLKEYFNIAHSKPHLHEIDEENNSEVSAGTPCFGGEHPQPHREHPYRKNRNKTELEDPSAPHEHPHKASAKMATLSLEEFGNPRKNAVKLPAIHGHRDSSRQGREREPASIDKKEGMQLALFLRKEEVGKGSIRQSNQPRRPIRSRVTATSFYHMNLRDRERIRTEEELEPALEKSFVITRYGALMRQKDDALKKYEQSFKLTKH